MTISLPNVRVLMAEADVELAERLQHVLEGMHVVVERELNGSRATDRILNEKFDLLLLAIELPIFSGPDVLSFCRQRQVACPAIAMVDEDDSLTDATLEQFGFAASVSRSVLEIEKLETAFQLTLPHRIEDARHVSRVASR